MRDGTGTVECFGGIAPPASAGRPRVSLGLAEEHRRPTSEEYDEALAMAMDLEAEAGSMMLFVSL